MKKQLNLMLLLLGVSFLVLKGCRKEDGLSTTIQLTSLASPKPGVETGTFIATGGLSTSGTFVMVIESVGSDSIHCTTTNTAPEGSFVTILDCSIITNKGKWYVDSGSGAYKFLKGKGSLFMLFPPDVPPGVLGTETQTGVVWYHK